MTEWSFLSRKTYADPFNEVELDMVFIDPDGCETRVPAFWAGGSTWRVRYASPKLGRHTYRTVCSDAGNGDLHGCQGELEIAPYEGDNPLFRHGPLKISENRRYLEHLDGTPFFWLGDTWWMGLTKRLPWPDGFQALSADRVQKGFSVIQIVAGLYPDMDWYDERGANEAGYPWDRDFSRINPEYFDLADRRIQYLVEAGLLPCIVGCWGYYLPWTGVETMKKHWRNLLARWGAWPVVWCLAGEGTMPYYLSETREADAAYQNKGWTELARYLHAVDPFRRLVSIHPSSSGRETVEDDSVLDFNMLQTGHGDRNSLPNTVLRVTSGRAAEPTMPVLNSEVCYEGIGEACRQEVQRMMFWTCMLSGACGHTYGANGIWQVNTREEPYGPSPHGMAWGNTPWEDAYRLPGSANLSLGKRLLERYDWWRFEPHPEWIDPCWSEEDYFAGYAAGIPSRVRIFFWPLRWNLPTIRRVEPDTEYRAFFFSPADGTEFELGSVRADADGDWRIPLNRQPIYQDWVLVMEAT
jgi:hypothetical protein